MPNWSLIIYGVAALWGVQSLLSLMASYRQQKLGELQQAEVAKLHAEARRLEEENARLPGLKSKSEPQPAKAA